jgi:hypothetical protein
MTNTNINIHVDAKIRKEFDRWAESKELNTTLNRLPGEFGYDYIDIETQMFWECWIASRLALVMR